MGDIYKVNKWGLNVNEQSVVGFIQYKNKNVFVLSATIFHDKISRTLKVKNKFLGTSYLNYSTGIHTDHGTNSTKCWILFLIVPYVSQRGAPIKV